MSNSKPLKPMSIEDTGLEYYLNRTAPIHNGYGYDDFVKMVESDVNKANLAKAFKVDRKTIYKWLALYNKT